MPDMLVKLYELPYDKTLFDNLEKENISVRRAKAPEKTMLLDGFKKNLEIIGQAKVILHFHVHL